MSPGARAVCWRPTWNATGLGLEHVRVGDRSADGVLLAVPDDGAPFRLTYRLRWDRRWGLREAVLHAATARIERSLTLRTDGHGQWRDAHDRPIRKLEGCTYLDIWPTPFTNTLAIRGERMKVGERRELRVAWVSAPDLSVRPRRQAYTRLSSRLYLFDSLDGSGFKAQLPVDARGIVLDYPGLFERVTR